MDEKPKEVATEEPKSRVRDLFVWRSMSRPIWQFGKEVFAVFGTIAFLVSVILAFFQEWLAIMVTWAALFLFWALTRLSPEEVDHKITTEGIISMNHAYLWTELGPFWYRERGTDLILHVSQRNMLGQVIILINPADKEKIRDILAEYLPYIEIPDKSTVEKLSEWFSKKFPVTPKPKAQQPKPPTAS